MSAAARSPGTTARCAPQADSTIYQFDDCRIRFLEARSQPVELLDSTRLLAHGH